MKVSCLGHGTMELGGSVVWWLGGLVSWWLGGWRPGGGRQTAGARAVGGQAGERAGMWTSGPASSHAAMQAQKAVVQFSRGAT